MINPVWLRSFCTLVETNHFTQTAEKLHITQSGVSQHIQKLENFLNRPLLTRYGKKFTLTHAGEQLYNEASKILLSLSDLEKRINMDPSDQGVIKLASPGSIGLKLYPFLLELQKIHPQLIIHYRFAPNYEIEKLISEQQVDIGLMTRLSSNSDVQLTPIGEESLLLITPPHILDPTWQQLQTLGFIDHPDGEYHANQLLGINYLEYQDIKKMKCSGFSNQITLILDPVKMGLGFTILPNYAVEAYADKHKIIAHQLKNTMTEKIYLGTHKNKFIPNSVKTVIDSIRVYLDKKNN